MHHTFLPLVLATALLSGCASQKIIWSEQADKQSLPLEWQQPSDSQTQSVASLLKLLGAPSPQIKELVSQALINNPTLQQTLINLKTARLDLASAQGEQLPTLNAELSNSRSESEDGSKHSLSTSKLTLRWELDLWQRLADQTEAAQFNTAAIAQDYRAARALLIANVIKQSLSLTARSQQLAVEQQRTQVLQSNQQTIIARYKSGLSSLDDLETSRTAYANAMATQSAQEEALQKETRSLLTLLGAPLSDLAARQKAESAVQSLINAHALPAVTLARVPLPAETLASRPDVHAALLRINNQDALTRAAYKALLPSFSLSAELSNSSSGASNLLKQDPLWSLLGNITAPLYQGGQLKAAAERQELQAELAYWSYREVLLTAIQEVEDAQGQDRSLQRQQTFQQQALTSARNSEKNYQNRYRQGLVDILDLLQAQQSRFDTQSNVIETERTLLTNRIDLGLALGLGI